MPTAVYLLAWFAFLIAAVALAFRFVPVVNHTVLGITAVSPYLMLGAPFSALLLLLARNWWAAAAPVALTAAVVFVGLPQFIRSDQIAGPSIPIRTLTANLLEGRADPEALIAIARERSDLLIVQELTLELTDALRRGGLESEFPYSALDARPSAWGVGIWSRYPIGQASRDSSYALGMVRASVRPPGAASDVVVLATHVAGPWPQPIDAWREEMAKLPDTLRRTARFAGDRAVIVGGDLNATNSMRPFRRLLRDGFRDASEQSGAGFTPTFPADRSIPPLIGIDHILTLNSAATDVQTVRIPGSDHLGLTATINVPA